MKVKDNLNENADSMQSDTALNSEAEDTATDSGNSDAIDHVSEIKSDDGSKLKRTDQYTWRDRFYGRIKVSVRTMDIIIWSVVGALVLVLLLGIIFGKRPI